MAGNSKPAGSSLHVVMFPFFAMGHLTSFLHTSNKLAERGHMISFIMPKNTIKKLVSFNQYPSLITLIPITLPSVPGLPREAETTSDVPYPFHPLLMTAIDRTKPVIADLLKTLKPDLVFHDFTHWLPELVQSLNLSAKTVYYYTGSAAAASDAISLLSILDEKQNDLTVQSLTCPPMNLPTYRAKDLVAMARKEYGSGITLFARLRISFEHSDALAFKGCREMEGTYLDRLSKYYQKPVLVTGPVKPEPPTVAPDKKWEDWLNQFKPKSVIFCALGSECILQKDQFQELVLGFEKTGLPFMAALKPPVGGGGDTTDSALPEGFKDRTKGRGVVHGGWVQQGLILEHPSVGCFVTHCGPGSVSEGLISECQLVLLPNYADQHAHARLMGRELKVGVQVEKRDEDGFFNRDGVFKAVKAVMDEDSEIGKEVRKNHAKLRHVLLKPGLERSYIDTFIQDLKSMQGPLMIFYLQISDIIFGYAWKLE